MPAAELFFIAWYAPGMVVDLNKQVSDGMRLYTGTTWHSNYGSPRQTNNLLNLAITCGDREHQTSRFACHAAAQY